MCGICGVVGTERQGAVKSMVSAMHHRGPDDQGDVELSFATIGMARLAVIDLTEAGHQPMSNEDGSVWIVYNGEVYNHSEERKNLEARGHHFQSHSDTEVVLRLYLEYGDEFLSRLRGIFALAIYDARDSAAGREKMLLARDHLGVKPLLYADTDAGLVFASEIKALLASGMVDRDVDPESLWFLMAYGSIPQPRSILRQVKMLPPGCSLVMKGDQWKIEQYWSLPGSAGSMDDTTYSEQVASVRQSLESAVSRQIVSDVPIGAFLSGGIDSTALVGLMAKTTGAVVKTYSIGFGAEGGELDETDDAAKVAEMMGTEHSRIEIGVSDICDRLPEFVRALDQPSVDGLNSWLVSDFAAQHVTVAISGTGGDELFAGYPWFGNVASGIRGSKGLMAKGVTSVGNFARMIPLEFIPRGMPSRAFEKIIAAGNVPMTFGRQVQMLELSQAKAMLNKNIRKEVHVNLAECFFTEIDSCSQSELGMVSRISNLCIKTYLQNQLLRDIDAVSMAHSLEVRVPFLDLGVVETALSLPDASKLTQASAAGRGKSYAESGAKRVLIDAVRDLLPEGFEHQKKRGFSMPMEVWLRGSLAQWREELLSWDVVSRRGLLDPDEISLLNQRFIAGKASWAQVWVPMILELWCREVLDGVKYA